MELAGTTGSELFSDLAGDHDFHPSQRDAGALAAALKRRHADRIVAELVVPARAARHAVFPPGLDPCLVGALRERGILQPYSHQLGHDAVGVAALQRRGQSPGVTLRWM